MRSEECVCLRYSGGLRGFIVGVQDARAYVTSGLYKRVVVVCAEKMSSMTDYQDRQTCPLFGDGAAAVLIEPVEDDSVGIMDAEVHIDGNGLLTSL